MVAITRGDIFMIPDEDLTLPPESLRGEPHLEHRPFLILSNDNSNLDPNFLVVMGCPISSSTSFRTGFDVKLSRGQGGVTKKCWIRVPAMQPLPKTLVETQDKTGTVPRSILDEVDISLVQFLCMGEG
ncbi:MULTISPECIES: type II toxin-antitoxin system PemK/MazF family toxin [Corynebacterium]|uniref:type II toxin-antitoxin system PemK/MazF family toxin n=2 Tax=Corynebacterium macclintockiae TaxID=2913501 RepID=UPI00054E7DE5|nr:type II toxin-antitoxin system PemK/MazF family toxin [Corynebacterium macclintockiae]